MCEMGKQDRSKDVLQLLLKSNIFKSNSKYKSRVLDKKPFYFVLLTDSYHNAISAKLLKPRMKTATAFRAYYLLSMFDERYLLGFVRLNLAEKMFRNQVACRDVTDPQSV